MTDHTSPEIGELLTAYVAAQGKIDNVTQDREVEVPIKDRQNPGKFKGSYKFRYATLPGILNHIRDALISNGLWYTQRVEDGDMVTRIVHRSGQWMDTGHVPLPDIKGDPAAIGAIISFFKRYSLNAAMGLAADDDDSGEVGDRDVSFRARGAARRTQADSDHDEAIAQVQEPAEGWGDWARSLMDRVRKAQSQDDLDLLKSDERRYINGVAKVDNMMWTDIRNAFSAREKVVNPRGGI